MLYGVIISGGMLYGAISFGGMLYGAISSGNMFPVKPGGENCNKIFFFPFETFRGEKILV